MRGSILLVLVAAASAYGDPKEEARGHFQTGRERFERGDYGGALTEFEAAYRSAPFAELLYNVARCQERLGRPVEAIQSYERYLAVTPAGPDRDELAAHLAELRRALYESPPPPEIATRIERPPARGARARRRWPVLLGAGAAAVAVVVVAVLLAVTLAAPSAHLDFPALDGSAR